MQVASEMRHSQCKTLQYSSELRTSLVHLGPTADTCGKCFVQFKAIEQVSLNEVGEMLKFDIISL